MCVDQKSDHTMKLFKRNGKKKVQQAEGTNRIAKAMSTNKNHKTGLRVHLIFVESWCLTGRPWQFARSNVAKTPLLLILSPARGKAEPTLNLR